MSSTVCAYPGCPLPAFIEPRTNIHHDFCGRTHAQAAGINLQEPHGTCMKCNLKGCQKQVYYDASNDRVHDFCTKDHASRAISTGQWTKPIRDQNLNKSTKSYSYRPSGYCAYAGCRLPVFVDDKTQRVHNYCGRTHAKLDTKGKANDYLGKKQSSGLTSTSSSSSNSQKAISTTSTSSVFTKFDSTGYAVATSGSSTPQSSSIYHSSNPYLGFHGNTVTTSSSSSSFFNSNSLLTTTPSTSITSSSVYPYQGFTGFAVASVPTKPLSTVQLPQDIDDCTICLSSMKDNKNIIVTVCGHRFHRNCLENWVITADSTNSTRSCPVCREDID